MILFCQIFSLAGTKMSRQVSNSVNMVVKGDNIVKVHINSKDYSATARIKANIKYKDAVRYACMSMYYDKSYSVDVLKFRLPSTVTVKNIQCTD